MITIRSVCYLVSSLSLIFLHSCIGFGYTLEGGTIPAKSFSIENFDNIAPLGNPALSISVQDLLRDRLLKETSLKSVSSDGDVNFIGTVVNYTITPVVGTGSSTVSLNRLTISLQITYSNKVDDKNDFVKTFTDFDDFDSSSDITSEEDELIQSIGAKLVNQIFNQVLIDW